MEMFTRAKQMHPDNFHPYCPLASAHNFFNHSIMNSSNQNLDNTFSPHKKIWRGRSKRLVDVHCSWLATNRIAHMHETGAHFRKEPAKIERKKPEMHNKTLCTLIAPKLLKPHYTRRILLSHVPFAVQNIIAVCCALYTLAAYVYSLHVFQF